MNLPSLALLATLLGATIAVSAYAQSTDGDNADVIDSGFALPQTFRDWWQTPSQQAAKAFQQGDNERLQRVAPTRDWQGAAAYRNRDFEAAQSAYSTEGTGADALTESVDEQRRRYNSATTEIQLGNYAAAIEQLDELLGADPNNQDAARNRAIAQRLLELEQQPQPSQGGESGENSEQQDGDSQDSDSQDSQSGENSSGEPQNSDGSESDSESDGDNSGDDNSPQEESSSESDSEDNSEGESGTQDEREQEVEAARQALQEANADAESEPTSEQAASGVEVDEPMSEEDQATEQWLRQIPDDPDDLLRRKLLQNHLSEFPDVQRNGNQY